jgi:hypothetical protein
MKGVAGYGENEEELALNTSPIRARLEDDPSPFDKPVDFGSLFDLDAGAKDSQHDAEGSNVMLGVPPPGANTDFLSQTPNPLPFPLTADPSHPAFANHVSRAGRFNAALEMQRQAGRQSPYKRVASSAGMRFPSQSHTNELFDFGGENDMWSSKMPSSMHKTGEPSVGINPAQLLASNAYDLTKTPAAARTMYGTELEGDTRFGEYGIDGIAKGFWKAPGFQY